MDTSNSAAQLPVDASTAQEGLLTFGTSPATPQQFNSRQSFSGNESQNVQNPDLNLHHHHHHHLLMPAPPVANPAAAMYPIDQNMMNNDSGISRQVPHAYSQPPSYEQSQSLSNPAPNSDPAMAAEFLKEAELSKMCKYLAAITSNRLERCVAFCQRMPGFQLLSLQDKVRFAFSLLFPLSKLIVTESKCDLFSRWIYWSRGRLRFSCWGVASSWTLQWTKLKPEASLWPPKCCSEFLIWSPSSILSFSSSPNSNLSIAISQSYFFLSELFCSPLVCYSLDRFILR